ncbi:MAG: cysteine desulfurase [Oscillospiraceae bacterium]|nr:cysteine desulfurase [Oscillospiraceae bacterium]
MIYFDNAATTKVIPEAAAAATAAMCEDFGNPSSLHGLGISAENMLSSARADIAEALSCTPREITFTSCGTESNNLAIFGAAARSGKRRHFVTTAYEHPSVLSTAKKLEADGFEVTYISPRDNGTIFPGDVAAAVRDDTFMVSVMSVNNEIGALMNIPAISNAVKLKNRDTLIHTDAVQAFLKIPINTKKYGADIISISGHKIHAPKGIGAIYIKQGVGLTPQLLGGGQERGLRSGTEPTAQIAAFAAAVRAGTKTLDDDRRRISDLSEKLQQELETLPNVHVLAPDSRAPHILNVSFTKYPSEVVMRILEEDGIYISAGSACSRGKKSHVLRALNVPERLIGSAVRISLSRFSTEEEVSEFISVAKAKLV